jgi:hypothetical protein
LNQTALPGMACFCRGDEKEFLVTDPYNTAQTYQPVASMASARTTTTDTISRLGVSDSWKRRFRLIEKAGGPDLPNFKGLSFGERYGLNFNFLAFLLGPIYYVAKGLWRQAIVFLACVIALVFLLDALGLDRFTRAIGYGFNVVYAMRANVSYYSRMVLGRAPWA